MSVLASQSPPSATQKQRFERQYHEHRQNRRAPYKQGQSQCMGKSPYYTSKWHILSTANSGHDASASNAGRICPSRTIRHRKLTARNAALFAEALGKRLSVLVTVTWWACGNGDRQEGNVLGYAEPERCNIVLARMRRVAVELGFSACWVWARAIGRDVGAHLHIYAYWPAEHLSRLVSELERLTGDCLMCTDRSGAYAQSTHGGWNITTNVRGLAGSVKGAEYLAEQDKDQANTLLGRCFGITVNINSNSQRKAKFNAEEYYHG